MSSKGRGEILRSLGLNTQQLGCLGRGLEISSKLKDQIHEIEKGLGICAGDLLTPEFPDPTFVCARCEKYGLGFDNTGRKLRYYLSVWSVWSVWALRILRIPSGLMNDSEHL